MVSFTARINSQDGAPTLDRVGLVVFLGAVEPSDLVKTRRGYGRDGFE